MAGGRPFLLQESANKTRSPQKILIIFFAVAFLIRLAIQRATGDLGSDYTRYLELAANLASGEKPAAELFSGSPLYIFWTALFAGVFGLKAVYLRVLQTGLGSLLCVFIYLLARRVTDWRVGLLSAAITILYSPLILYGTILLPVSIAVLTVTLAIRELSRAAEEGKLRHGLLAGVWLGLGICLRQDLVIFFFPAFIWLIVAGLRRTPARLRVLTPGLVLCGIAIVILPVFVTLGFLSENFIKPVDTLGARLYAANRPTATGLNYAHPPLADARDIVAPSPGIVGGNVDFSLYRRLAEQNERRRLTPREVSKFWRHELLVSIARRPAVFRNLMLRKAYYFWNGYETHDTVEALLKMRAVRLLPLVTFHILGPLGLCGMFLAWQRRREMFFLYALVGSVFVSSLVLHAGSAMRLLMIPALIIFAALAVDTLLIWIQLRSRHLVKLVVALLALSVVLNWKGKLMNETVLRDEAIAEAVTGRRAQAVLVWKALAEKGKFYPGDAHRALAAVYKEMGEPEKSELEVERALGLFSPASPAAFLPGDTETPQPGDTLADKVERYRILAWQKPGDLAVGNTLGLLYVASGMYSKACQEFERLLSFEPYQPIINYNLGYARAKRGHYEASVEAFTTALETGLKFSHLAADAHFNIAASQYNLGRLAEATAECARTVELRPHFDEARYRLALLYMEQGKKELAREELEKLIASPAYGQTAKKLLGSK